MEEKTEYRLKLESLRSKLTRADMHTISVKTGLTTQTIRNALSVNDPIEHTEAHKLAINAILKTIQEKQREAEKIHKNIEQTL